MGQGLPMRHFQSYHLFNVLGEDLLAKSKGLLAASIEGDNIAIDFCGVKVIPTAI